MSESSSVGYTPSEPVTQASLSWETSQAVNSYQSANKQAVKDREERQAAARALRKQRKESAPDTQTETDEVNRLYKLSLIQSE